MSDQSQRAGGAAGLREDDVISLLKHQHEQIKDLFAAVESSSGRERQEEFDHLRALLAVHETAEEQVLRPVTRAAVPGGSRIADARMEEENEAKKVLAQLEKMGTDAAEFTPLFTQLKHSVIEHAESEEHEEFSAIHEHRSHDQLVKMAAAIRAAEKMAPTHPHPSIQSTTSNYLTGPFAAMVDKVRDALSKHSGE